MLNFSMVEITKYLIATDEQYHVLWLHSTVLPESIYPLGRGRTSSLPKCSAANSLRWDEFLNLVLDGRDRMPRQVRRDIPR